MTTKEPLIRSTPEQVVDRLPIEPSNLLTTLLTPEQAASRLGIEPSTLASWRHYHSRKKRRTGGRPVPRLKFVSIGRVIRYRPQDLEDFIQANVTESSPKQSPRRPSPGRPRKSKAA